MKFISIHEIRKTEDFFINILNDIDLLKEKKDYNYFDLSFFICKNFNCQLKGKYIYILLLDILQFIAYNHKYGHIEGDKILDEIEVLSNKFDNNGIYTRISGDEYLYITDKEPENIVKTLIEYFKNKDIEIGFVQIQILNNNDKTTSYTIENYYEVLDRLMYFIKRTHSHTKTFYFKLEKEKI